MLTVTDFARPNRLAEKSEWLFDPGFGSWGEVGCWELAHWPADWFLLAPHWHHMAYLLPFFALFSELIFVSICRRSRPSNSDKTIYSALEARALSSSKNNTSWNVRQMNAIHKWQMIRLVEEVIVHTMISSLLLLLYLHDFGTLQRLWETQQCWNMPLNDDG